MSRIEEIADKVRELIDAQYCCDELADAAESWLDSIETDQFEKETEKLMEEADQLLQEARETKENGGQYCNCEACSLSLEILSMLGEEI